MATPSNQYIDMLFNKIDQLPIGTPEELARVLPLYIKAINDNGIVKNVSFAYIDNYDGRKFYKKFKKHLDQISLVFSKNGLLGKDVRVVFKKVAFRSPRIPTTMKGMEILKGIVFEEIQGFLRSKKLAEKREKLVSLFKIAVKHYLNMTYELGFNEPSACVRHLVENHTIDKYIMSGDFAVLLLPFMPEVEEAIRKNYEHYEMKDAWENLKGRYFNHKAEYANLATEIKSTFNRTIRNFSQYFDSLYTDTYYKMMLSRRRQDG
jgi:hypothetical protein